ncbi:MAG: ABC transporter substrate-binding protein [Propionibacteriaceae bacterium]|jgi:ribose transport system substrate-binding protein|nr:ABC transporter substrate-binding protein [Propionibacteriaceae bacterium]
MRKIIAVVAALMVSLSLASCSNDNGGGTSTGGSASGDKPFISIVSKGFQHQFWQAVKSGAEARAAELGVEIEFIGPASESEVEAQMTMLDNALAKKPAAIGFAALDSQAAAGTLTKIKDAGIPVIAFDSGVDSDIPLTTAATDNKVAAKEGAKHMCELIGNKGKVALIVHDQVSKSGTDRRDGFLEGMKEYCPDVTVLEPQYGGGDQAKSADIAKSIMTANPDLSGIFGSNEGSAIGALKGVQEANMAGKIVLIGFDSGKAQLDAIRSGEMNGAITQDPVGMGAAVVQAAVDAIDGKTLPKFIDTGFYWYDKTNIDDPKIAAVLYD